MVTFAQNMGGFKTPNLSEVTKICTQHLGCKDCPSLTQSLNISGVTVTCVTGKQKGVKQMRRVIKLSDIVVTEAFANTTPREEKMEECRRYWNENKKQDRFIVVNRHNVLIDGYIQYLVLKENGVEEVEIRIGRNKESRWKRIDKEDWWDIPAYREKLTTYIFGNHPKATGGRSYMWRVPSNWAWVANNIQVGDVVFCRNKNGVSPVLIERIEVLDKCPVDYPVRKMCYKTIKRNGKVVE